MGTVYNPSGKSNQLPGGLRKFGPSESPGELGICRNPKKGKLNSYSLVLWSYEQNMTDKSNQVLNDFAES